MSAEFRRLPPLNGLRVFEVVSRHLNFRLAAEELGVTQGAVAQQIRGLEADLGQKLFDRGPRSLAPTDAGRSYVANIRRAFELIAEATEALRPEPKHLTISVTPSFASKWLIPRLPAFTAAHPDIDLRILASERMANFQADAVDLAVRYGRPPFGPGLTATLLFEQVLVAVASPLLVERLGEFNAPGGQVAYPLLHDAHDVWPQFLEKAWPDARPVAAKNMRFNQTTLAIDAAIAGQGAALASLLFVRDDIEAGRLMRLSTTDLQVDSDFYLVHPRKPRHAESLDVVKSWFIAATANPPSTPVSPS